ncbi:MAG TPA: PQQ-binding-like beta-propeller repeat protein [Pyrinomonadaceae bacterium]
MTFNLAGRAALAATLGRVTGALAVGLLLVITASNAAAENWPQYRGPGGQGVSAEKGLPAKWGAGGGVRWKTRLPGPGHSSPIVWGDHIFLTAYAPAGEAGRGRLLALCIDKLTGKILWEREVRVGQVERVGGANAPATPTPVTDGRRVYVYFGSYGLVCFDFEGRKVWERPLGPCGGEFGSASSPVLHGRLLVLSCTSDSDGFLLAADKETGRTVWRTPHAQPTLSFATPFVWKTGAGHQLVLAVSGHVKGFDPGTGRELWRVGGVPKGVAPTPASAHGLLYAASNSQPNFIIAIRPGGQGDITATHVAWRYDKGAVSVPSPLVIGDHLFALRDGGIMTCLDARSGAVVWQQRLPARGNYFASPVTGDGKIYAINEEGEVTVIAAKSVFELIATNSMGERAMASPAISGGSIFIRTDENLYRVEVARGDAVGR